MRGFVCLFYERAGALTVLSFVRPLAEDADPLLSCFRRPLLGSVCSLGFSVQHSDETILHRLICLHCLFDVCEI